MTAQNESAKIEVKEMENDCENEKKIKIDFDCLTVVGAVAAFSPAESFPVLPRERAAFRVTRAGIGARQPLDPAKNAPHCSTLLLDQLQIKF